jgi:hypothetical protein
MSITERAREGKSVAFVKLVLHRYIIHIHIQFICESDVRYEHDLPACKEHLFATMP